MSCEIVVNSSMYQHQPEHSWIVSAPKHFINYYQLHNFMCNLWQWPLSSCFPSWDNWNKQCIITPPTLYAASPEGAVTAQVIYHCQHLFPSMLIPHTKHTIQKSVQGLHCFIFSHWWWWISWYNYHWTFSQAWLIWYHQSGYQ